MGKSKRLKNPQLKCGNHFCPKDIQPPIKYNSFKPAFSFRHINYGSKECLSTCDQESKSSITDTILLLSQLTWNEIISRPREKLGYEKIPNDQFKSPLPAIITPDVSMLVFRFSAIGRIVGFREKDIYHIVQVSSTHDLY